MGTSRVPPLRPWLRSLVRGFSILSTLLVLSHAVDAADRYQGVILHAGSGAPIAGAIVRVLPGGEVALSGQDGTFDLTLPHATPVTLLIRRVGFAPADLSIGSVDTVRWPLEIRLQEAVYAVDPVVTTATREAVTSDDIPFAIDVVSGKDLRLRTSSDLGELLGSVPGVLLQSYGGLGDIQTLSIRGSTASQVLILLDGQRLNSTQSGEIDLSTLPLESVQRVEVVRGSASAQYGADAMGGVVNIITGDNSDVDGVRLSAGTTIGSFGTRGANVGAALGGTGISGSVFYRYLQSDNDFSYTGADGTESLRRNADLLSHVVTGRLETRLNETGSRITLSGEYLHQESGDPGSMLFPLSRARKLTRNVLGSLNVEQPLGAHLLSVQPFLQVLRFGYTDPDNPFSSNDNRNTAAGAEINDIVSVSDRFLLTGGYSYRSDRYTGNSLGGAHVRGSHGLYVQADLRPVGFTNSSPWSLCLVPAVRWDQSNDFGSAVSPKIGFTASTGSEFRLTLKGNAGLSFRAPTFNDLYWPFDGYTAGNPSLSPERSRDFDAGLSLSLKGDAQLRAGMTYFRNNVRDLILWARNQNSVWSPSNVGRATIDGVESSVQFSLVPGVIRLGWSLSTLRAVNRADDPTVNGKTIPYRPSAMNKVNIVLTQGNVELTGELVAMSRRFTDEQNTSSLPPVHTIDISLGYRVPIGSSSVSFLLLGKNLENVQYETIDGYPLPGREARLTIQYSAAFERRGM